MLHITVPAREYFNEETQEFSETKECSMVMEHSLISISKWEAKWKKSYFSTNNKTTEEVLDYLRCMTISPQGVDWSVYANLPDYILKQIREYIDDPMTATTISDASVIGHSRKQVITSELVYYWMIAQNIPIEFEKWHINRLLTLIKVCSIKNNPNPKKMNRSAIVKQNRAINAARRAKYSTKG